MLTYKMNRGSSDPIASTGQYTGTFAVSSSHHLSRPSVIGTSLPVRLSTKTCSTSGHCLSALSTICFVAIDFPPRRPSLRISGLSALAVCGPVPTHSVVMITLHSQSFTRSRSDSALNPAKTAECTAPIRAHARNAAAACHVMGK